MKKFLLIALSFWSTFNSVSYSESSGGSILNIVGCCDPECNEITTLGEAQKKRLKDLDNQNKDLENQNQKIFLQRLQIQAEAGALYAQTQLADIYYFAHNNEPKDYQKAFYWYSKAADAGSAHALNNLAFMVKNGYGCEKDYQKALSYFHKAIDSKKPPRITWFNIAAMYYGGKGVEKDEKKAFEYFAQGLRKSPHKKSLFDLIYYLQNRESSLPQIKTSKPSENTKLTPQEIEEAFKKFTSCLTPDDQKEAPFLQLIADFYNAEWILETLGKIEEFSREPKSP